MLRFVMPLLIALAPALRADEPMPIPPPETTFMLIAIDGQPVTAPTTLAFQGPDRVGGRAPCNSWFVQFVGPLPAFAIGPAGATRMACPAMNQEQAFFSALAEMTTAALDGPSLTLSNPAGRQMAFLRVP